MQNKKTEGRTRMILRSHDKMQYIAHLCGNITWFVDEAPIPATHNYRMHCPFRRNDRPTSNYGDDGVGNVALDRQRLEGCDRVACGWSIDSRHHAFHAMSCLAAVKPDGFGVVDLNFVPEKSMRVVLVVQRGKTV
jgi:hypothetical protein